jgi:hypothetical protein
MLGLITGSYPAVLNEFRLSLPRNVLIHVVALFTTGSMVIVFVVQTVTGLIIDPCRGARPPPPQDYETMFGVLAAALAAATIAYAWCGPRRSNAAQA